MLLEANTALPLFFLMVRDIKLARNGVFDIKEHKEMVPGHEQEEMVPGPMKNLHVQYWTINKCIITSS